jgi:hypothetical protein
MMRSPNDVVGSSHRMDVVSGMTSCNIGDACSTASSRGTEPVAAPCRSSRELGPVVGAVAALLESVSETNSRVRT